VNIVRVITEFLFIDPRKMKSYMERISKWRKKAREALKSRDPKLLMKIQREKKVINELMLEMTKMRYKSMMIMMTISLIIFFFIVLPYKTVYLYVPALGRKLNGIWFFVLMSISISALASIVLKYKGYM